MQLIMLLRFSVRQVSFLHVYHHATITLIWWFITFSAPGGMVRRPHPPAVPLNQTAWNPKHENAAPDDVPLGSSGLHHP